MDAIALEKFTKSITMTHLVCKAKGKDRIVEGFASTTAVDHTFDKVTEGGLRSLAETLKNQTTVLLNHDSDQPIGKLLAVEVKETPEGIMGLWVQLSIDPSEEKLWSKLQHGTINKFSWSGMVEEMDFMFDEVIQCDIRLLTKIKAFEVSLVSIPANNTAAVTDVRIGKFLTGEKNMETVITEKDGAPVTDEKKTETETEKNIDDDKSTTLLSINVDGLTDEQKNALLVKLGVVSKSEADGDGESEADGSSETEGSDSNESEENDKTEKESESKIKTESKSDVSVLRSELKELTDDVKQIIAGASGDTEDEDTDDVAKLRSEIGELKSLISEMSNVLKTVPIRKSHRTEENDASGDKEENIFESDEYKNLHPREKLALAVLIQEQKNKE